MKKPGIFKAVAMTLFLFAASFGTAQAQDPLCDATLWTQMTQRATLLGQMETATAENLIYKPDSVLEYTCFNRFVSVSVYHMPYYMTPYYLTEIIQAGVTQYLYHNFGHTYLGGRLVPGGAATPPPAGTYVCDAMTWVWEAAKCLNFSQTEPQDSIYDLITFAGAVDIRQKPNACTNSPFPGAYGDLPVKGEYVSAKIPLTPVDCGQPIPTGLVISQPLNDGESRPETYNEKICPNPACHYLPTAMDSGICQL